MTKGKEEDRIKNLSKIKQTIKYKRNRKIKLSDIRLEIFLEEFLRNGGNATEAAFAVGSYNSIYAAKQAGVGLLKRAREIGSVYLERQGFGYGKMLDIAEQKMMMSDKPEWWDRLMKIAGYENFFDRKSQTNNNATINVFNLQKKQQEEYGFEGVQDAEVIEGEK